MVVTRLRGRLLLLAFVASQVLPLVAITVVWPEWATAKPSLRFPEAVGGLLGYAGLFGWVAWMFARRGDTIRDLFGPLPAAHEIRWAAGMGVGLVGVAMGAFALLYLPLVYLIPDYVQWIVDHPPLIAWSGPAFHVANVLTLVMLVVGAPLVEETFFRGCVLPSLSVRRGTRRGVIVSSLLFGVLHADIIGAVVFAVVMATVFLSTRSLWLPVVMHASNNAIVWLIAAIDFAIVGERPTATLADVISSWWMGAVGLAVGLPIFIVLWKKRPRSIASDAVTPADASALAPQ
jgi:membrane protease YdiL (CAAX protease family)